MPDWVVVAVAIFGALGGLSGVTALLSLRHEARKVNAEVQSSSARAHDVVIQNLLTDYERLNDENEELRQQIAELRNQLQIQQERYSILQETLDAALTRIRYLEQCVQEKT